ncbi:MAG TPA: TraM recognition domain-containing protein [Patescibacteria group bacterium]|nr:TraM recognition domain-containing protein [Patescibacteria group bacterium]
MALREKYQIKGSDLLRDARPWTVRMKDAALEPSSCSIVFAMIATGILATPVMQYFADVVFILFCLYFRWLMKQKVSLPFKLPKSAQIKDPNFKQPDGSLGMADGILYLGNDHETGEEIWFTNSDARTHCLYLGTTGSGKTYGLKSYAVNALCWGSGFIYIDGKADTSLWSTISAMARRFGRDDDLLIMNYMTGNATGRVPSNTLNPFSSGSASYLTNMLVSLMPDSEGDNAMWKERAVALVSSLMPCLVWKRDNQNIPLSIGVIRTFLTFKAVIKLSRDPAVPDLLRVPVKAYLAELPGYVDNVFDDEGNEKPMPPDAGAVDTSVPRQQHGYLSMQFTRSMQSLGDDYGFIFDTQAADVDMLDVVINRRILIVLIPALEKSSDETANLGKIISSTLKGMMGATLGNSVEGESSVVIENKPTNSATPFIAIFDEVGYYTASGMAVMAAQARSLGFSLVFAGQDLPALEKRVKEEARSITANCNIKLFGKLEDPTQTKDFFEKTVGTALVTEVSGFQRGQQGGGGKAYMDSQQANVQQRARASYDGLKGFTEGRAICAFGKSVVEMQVYNSHIGDAKAMRVHRFLPIPPPAEEALESLRNVNDVLKRLRNPKWDPAALQSAPNNDIEAMAAGFASSKKAGGSLLECGILAVAQVAEAHSTIKPEDANAVDAPSAAGPGVAPTAASPAEKAAAVAVAQATGNTGPLNWMQVIGAGDAATSPVRRDPPVTEAQAAQPPKPVSWEDVISAGGAQAKEAAVAASSAALPAPISWMDVIGGASATVGPNAVEEARNPVRAQQPAQQPVQQPAEQPVQQQPMMSPPWDPAPAVEQLAQAASKEIKAPLSWADVIGTDANSAKDGETTT